MTLGDKDCLFLAPNFPDRANVYYDHYEAAAGIFRKVVLRPGPLGDWPAGSLAGKVKLPFLLSRHFRLLKREIARIPVDVIFAHGIRWPGFVGAQLARSCNLPLALFVHSATPEHETGYLRAVSRRAFAAASCTLFASEGQFRNYSRRFDIRNGTVTGNPVDTDAFKVPEENEGERDRVDVVFAGRPTREKGFLLLLDLIDRFAAEGRDLRFHVRTDTALLTAADRARLAARPETVTWGHYLDRQEWSRLLGRACMLLSLSRFESFSYVVAESLACGTPVVATDCDGPRDLVDEGSGLLIPAGDLDRTHDAVVAMAEGHQRYDRSGMRARIVERCSREAVAGRIEEALSAVVAPS